MAFVRCPKQISRGFAEDFQAGSVAFGSDTARFYVLNIILKYSARARAHAKVYNVGTKIRTERGHSTEIAIVIKNSIFHTGRPLLIKS